MRRPLLVLSFAVALSSCANPSNQGSLRVQVNLESHLQSRCARLVAHGFTQRESTPVVLFGRSNFVIGIVQDDEGPEVILQAQGYSDEGCTTLTEPSETSELLSTRFASPTAAVMLTLRASSSPAIDAGVDADGDGFLSGPDCDDTNAAIHPAAAEGCANGADDDCDSATDCADASCDTQGCGTSGRCTQAVCVAPSERGLCADALDNDGDGAVDCADTDCPQGSACSDSNACTRGDTCGGGRCAGVEVSCQEAPSGQCFSPAGRCDPASGGACIYEVRAGSCDDGLACTLNDTCRPDGSCLGTPRPCDSAPNPCASSVGQCSEAQGGACIYPPLVGPCDDQDNCTLNDVCSAAGVCGGTRVTCTPPGECFTAGACTASGGCTFNVRSGACSGGTCSAAGVCVPTVTAVPFPFTPSNFSPSQLPASAGVVAVNCDVTIDTQASSGGLGWSTCAGGPPAPPSSVANGLMLIHFDALTIAPGVTVRAIGARPLIIAVRGAMVIDGTLTASSVGVQGAGSEFACGSGVGSDGEASGEEQTAGGGGGGGFASNGGRGSEGDDGGEGGERGESNGNSDLTPLRGGCRGGAGGRSASGSGLGGRGGGAVQVSAGTLTVNPSGTVSAHGEGGKGGLGNQRIGGGGGGSGGALFLEAGSLFIHGAAAVVANGGAGGEGSGSTNGGDGQSGQRSEDRAWPISLTCGGNGGAGGAREDGPGQAREPNCGDDFAGGGGGGSAGRIRFNAVNACTISPWATISPAPNSTSRCD